MRSFLSRPVVNFFGSKICGLLGDLDTLIRINTWDNFWWLERVLGALSEFLETYLPLPTRQELWQNDAHRPDRDR